MAKQDIVEVEVPEVDMSDVRMSVLKDKNPAKYKEERTSWVDKRMASEHPEIAPAKKVTKPKADNVEAPKETKPEPAKEITEPDNQPVETETKPDPVEEIPAEEQPETVETKPDDAQEQSEPQEVDDKTVEAYALKQNLTLTEAREELEGDRATALKYKNDPLEIAKAYRIQRREFERLKNQSEQTKQAQSDPKIAEMIQDPEGFVNRSVAKNSEKILADFKAKYPAKARSMEDDAILEEVSASLVAQVQQNIRGYQAKTKQDAISKREEFLNSIPERDKRFMADIKSTLTKLPDHQIIASNFKFNDLVYWARGQHTEKLEKEAYERGFKAASEQRVIVGTTHTKETSQSTTRKVTSKNPAASVTSYQRQQANQMFASIPDENDRIAAYLDSPQSKGYKKR